MLKIDPWPGRGLRLSGRLRANVVEPLVEAIQNLRDEGSTALHLQGVTEATTDAAQLLKGWLTHCGTGERTSGSSTYTSFRVTSPASWWPPGSASAMTGKN
jgi:hypothetical protein